MIVNTNKSGGCHAFASARQASPTAATYLLIPRIWRVNMPIGPWVWVSRRYASASYPRDWRRGATGGSSTTPDLEDDPVNRAVVTLALLALAFAVPAEAEDINGWLDAKWGMTPDEVQKVLSYPTSVADLAKVCGENCDEGAALEVGDYALNGQHFTVRLWFTKPDMRLNVVSMYATQLENSNDNTAFTKMKNFLENVYGSPRSMGLKRGYFVITWELPSTTITLHSNSTNEMTVVYEERTDKEGGGS